MQTLPTKKARILAMKALCTFAFLSVIAVAYTNCSKVSLNDKNADLSSLQDSTNVIQATKSHQMLYTTVGMPVTSTIELMPKFVSLPVRLSLDRISISDRIKTAHGEIIISSINPMEFSYTPEPGFRAIDTGTIYLLADGFESGSVQITIDVSNPRNLLNSYSLAVRGIACFACHAEVRGTLVTDLGLGLTDYYGNSMFMGGSHARASGAPRKVDALAPPPTIAADATPTGCDPRTTRDHSCYPLLNEMYSPGVHPSEGGFYMSTNTITPDSPSAPSVVVPNVYLDTATTTPPQPLANNATLLEKRDKYPFTFGWNYIIEAFNIASLAPAVAVPFDYASPPKLADYFSRTLGGATTKSYKTVHISGPPPEKLMRIWNQAKTIAAYKIKDAANNDVTNALYFPDRFGESPPVKGLSQTTAGIVYNDSAFAANSGALLECEGDILINGTARFANINLKSQSGCRIYATQTIFIDAPLKIPSHIQFSSARAIMFGIGTITTEACRNVTTPGNLNRFPAVGNSVLKRRFYFEPPDPSFFVATADLYFTTRASSSTNVNKRPAKDVLLDIIADSDAVDAMPGLGVRADASCRPGGYKVDFEHVLLNAPIIQGRYAGAFKGMIIAEIMDWAKGQFHFQNDPVFSVVPLLPLLDFSNEILKITDEN